MHIGVDTKIKLRVQGLTNSQIRTGAYALILAEEGGERRIPVIVGTAEAQSVAFALEGVKPPRPLTHDLFITVLENTDMTLSEIIIYKFEDGVFFSELILEHNGECIHVDSRTSDAIAIALRAKSNIYTTEAILKKCGVVLNDNSNNIELVPNDDDDDDIIFEPLDPSDIKDEKHLQEWLSNMLDEDLTERLENAIKSENYEFAQLYKDELARRDRNK